MLRHRAYPRCCLFVSTLTLISASSCKRKKRMSLTRRYFAGLA
ncbi:hypothetical protein [Enterobacter hormaechei]